jgi:hypothetical protein
MHLLGFFRVKIQITIIVPRRIELLLQVVLTRPEGVVVDRRDLSRPDSSQRGRRERENRFTKNIM